MTREKKKKHYFMIKGSIHQGNIMTLNVYTSNNRAWKTDAVKSDRGGEKKNRQTHSCGWKLQYHIPCDRKNKKSSRILKDS